MTLFAKQKEEIMNSPSLLELILIIALMGMGMMGLLAAIGLMLATIAEYLKEFVAIVRKEYTR